MRNIAVVGSGYWGQNLVRNYHSLGVLKTVCDLNWEMLKKFQIQYQGIEITVDYNAILNDKDIKAIVIALPAALHFEYAERAIQHGKDVYVEKPLALRLDHAERLIKLASEFDRILMVGHLLHYHPAFVQLKKLVSDGELGKIQYIYSNRLSLGKIRREENTLWSFAPHDISMILSLVNEMPDQVRAEGANYLHKTIADVTTTHLSFPSGIKGHIFVSWLHPFKEQKLIIVADRKMAVFEDTQPWDRKIALYPHSIKWQNGLPIPEKADVEYVPVIQEEPLMEECRHFMESVATRRPPKTDGQEGYRVLKVLDQAQKSLELQGVIPEPQNNKTKSVEEKPSLDYSVHESAYLDQPCEIGKGTKIWHFSHIQKGARIGKGCNIGQNVNIASDVVIGDNVKIQNNVSVYTGAIIDDDVFLGPSCVLTNVSNPRSQINRNGLYEKTHIQKGASIGANATIVCGITIGRYSFVAAGAVVTKDVPDYGLMTGVPARRTGWMSRHGHKLTKENDKGIMICPESGYRYLKTNEGLRCLDLDEAKPLPDGMKKGTKTYDEFKLQTTAETGRNQ